MNPHLRIEKSTGCGKKRLARTQTRAKRLQDYSSIIEGLLEENFDENSNLTSVFLSKFTSTDIFRLITSFKQDEIPGKGQNLWPIWAERYPQHTEIEWATIWTFWLRLSDDVKKWEDGEETWRENARTEVLDRFSAADMDLLIQATRADQSLSEDDWSAWESKNPQHTAKEWSEYFFFWLKPLLPYVLKGPVRDSPSEVSGRGAMSRLARKFGPSVHFQFQVTGEDGHTMERSGLTPTEPLLGHPVQTSMEYERGREYVDYQELFIGRDGRSGGYGMSLKELYLTEAISEKPRAPSSLTNEIMPLLARDRWSLENYVGAESMPDGREFDVLKYDDLWEAMVPSLRLASKLLTESHLETWWDDLAQAINEPGKANPANLEVRTNQVDSNNNPVSFFKRTNPSDHTEYRKRINWSFMVDHLTFGIGENEIDDDDIDAITFLDVNKTLMDDRGYVSLDPAAKHVALIICTKLMIPMMAQGDKKMTEAEKLVHNFYLASVLCHEIAHAYAYIYQPIILPHFKFEGYSKLREELQRTEEPFYDGEDFSELGWSMENAVWGGIPVVLVKDPRESDLKSEYARKERLPIPALMIETPVMNFLNRKMMTITINDEQWEASDLSLNNSPFPLHFIEEIQRDGFWDIYVKACGGELLKLRPILTTKLSKGGEYNKVKREKYWCIGDGDLLKKDLDLMDRENEPKWYGKVDDSATEAYFRKKMEYERSIVLNLKMSYEEEARHKKIREQRSTFLERSQVEQYKERRAVAKRRFDYEATQRRIFEEKFLGGMLQPPPQPPSPPRTAQPPKPPPVQPPTPLPKPSPKEEEKEKWVRKVVLEDDDWW